MRNKIFEVKPKLGSELFPIEAFRALAEWFLEMVVNVIPAINTKGLNADSFGIVKQISSEQMEKFVDIISQNLFNQIKDIPICITMRRIPLSISNPLILLALEEAKFPELCKPNSNLIKPTAFILHEGQITFDDGYKVGHIYKPDLQKPVLYKSHLIDTVKHKERFEHESITFSS